MEFWILSKENNATEEISVPIVPAIPDTNPTIQPVVSEETAVEMECGTTVNNVTEDPVVTAAYVLVDGSLNNLTLSTVTKCVETGSWMLHKENNVTEAPDAVAPVSVKQDIK